MDALFGRSYGPQLAIPLGFTLASVEALDEGQSQAVWSHEDHERAYRRLGFVNEQISSDGHRDMIRHFAGIFTETQILAFRHADRLEVLTGMDTSMSARTVKQIAEDFMRENRQTLAHASGGQRSELLDVGQELCDMLERVKRDAWDAMQTASPGTKGGSTSRDLSAFVVRNGEAFLIARAADKVLDRLIEQYDEAEVNVQWRLRYVLGQ